MMLNFVILVSDELKEISPVYVYAMIAANGLNSLSALCTIM
jgi:hypothetical protein